MWVLLYERQKNQRLRVIKTSEHICSILANLPGDPGVYQYYDSDGTLLYVGKAKNLKKRVVSYFRGGQPLSGKLSVLVRKIADIRYIVVETEYEALLLENSLIKEHQPRYNVMLKDDKTYPWISIRRERFPRVAPTRRPEKDLYELYGPYASVRMMNTLLELIRQLYPLRNCSYHLSEENILKKKFRVCLKYHIGSCLGPCEGLQPEADYEAKINHIREIIRGNIHSVQHQLKKTMMELAGRFEFEQAQIVKEKIEILQKYQSKSTVVSNTINNVDVFTILHESGIAYVNFLKVISGAIVQAHTVEIKIRMDETPLQVLEFAIAELRSRFESTANEIIVPFLPEIRFPGVKFSVPGKGDKKKLLLLSESNVRYFKADREKQKDMTDPDRHQRRILDQAMKDLRLNRVPETIECFDNSNLQGTSAVAAMVVFRHARPDKKEYRHFNIKTVSGPDDFASMEEVVGRRYQRLLNENKPMPDLIVIDGGKGQIHAARKALEKLGLENEIPLIGIAKRLEEIFIPGDPDPLYLDKKSETLRLIQQMRDEAHRFGISHHRKRRGKESLKTSLSDIGGIGEETARKLLKTFKSVQNIKLAGEEKLAEAIGKSKAKLLTDWFSQTD